MPPSWLLAGLGYILPIAVPLASAQPVQRPIVVELFTSQGCSSCPPADAQVAELAERRPDLLALTFHVTYWNSLGWQDPFSFKGATDRQRGYVAASVSPQVYTPAMVVDGKLDAVGSDRRAVFAALARAKAEAGPGAAVDVVRRGGTLSIAVGPGSGSGMILLLGYDRQHVTTVGRGENSGRTLRETNVVCSMTTVGRWTGAAAQVEVPVPVGEDAAVIVQAADGRIVGAARAVPAS